MKISDEFGPFWGKGDAVKIVQIEDPDWIQEALKNNNQQQLLEIARRYFNFILIENDINSSSARSGEL